MRTSNFSRNHAYAKARGWVSPNRAASALPNVSDLAGNEVANASEILISGGTVSEPEDGIALITLGGLSQSSNSGGGGSGSIPGTGGFPGSGGMPVFMRNNSSVDLIRGDVVVTDPTDDSAVTTTTTEGDTRIAGVVQEPIGRLQYGPVLFNGLTTAINTTGSVSRGDYALTSTTAARAAAAAARTSGTFAVYLTGTDLPDFAAASVTTEAETPVVSLDIEMPEVIPAGRILFLALWLESGVSPTLEEDWTRIGAESGFYYYTKVAEGDDTATATFDASTAVATVLLLHPNVSLSVPVEDHDYDTSTSAAAVSGLSSAPRYAIAGVDADTTPGSGFVRLGGGSASFSSSGGAPALVQSAAGVDQATFSSTLTTGNLMVGIPFTTGTNDTWTTDPRQGGTCPIDSNMTRFGTIGTNLFGSSNENGTAILAKTVSSDTYSGPFGSPSGCNSSDTYLVLMEFENAGISGYEVVTDNNSNSSPIDLGTFTVGANDIVIMAVVGKSDGYGGSPDPVIAPNGFTQVLDGYNIINGWTWVGYKVGDGDASVTFSDSTFANGGWAAIAVHLTQGAQSAAGTLAGKYIGTASSATSPFTGGGAQNDAIFAINLMSEAKPSALLYGPDLLGADAGSGADAEFIWKPVMAYDGTNWYVTTDGSGNAIMAFSPV